VHKSDDVKKLHLRKAKNVTAASQIDLTFIVNHITINRNDAVLRPLMPEPEHNQHEIKGDEEFQDRNRRNHGMTRLVREYIRLWLTFG
jgi:hypothetical protein